MPNDILLAFVCGTPFRLPIDFSSLQGNHRKLVLKSTRKRSGVHVSVPVFFFLRSVLYTATGLGLGLDTQRSDRLGVGKRRDRAEELHET